MKRVFSCTGGFKSVNFTMQADSHVLKNYKSNVAKLVLGFIEGARRAIHDRSLELGLAIGLLSDVERERKTKYR